MTTKIRDFIKTGGLVLTGLMTGAAHATGLAPESNTTEEVQEGMFVLPPLGFAYNALEPNVDARTMEIHHTKHHQTYITKLNAALEKEPSLKTKSLEQLLSSIKTLPESVKSDIRNHGGGHWNHSFFWTVIGPDKNAPSEKLLAAIHKDFGNIESFKDQFERKSVGIFGSGWGWLVKDAKGKLSIISTPNQDNPLMDIAETNAKPILGVDVWEHAYYLNYQNRRPDYLKAFWNIVNWQKVSELYES